MELKFADGRNVEGDRHGNVPVTMGDAAYAAAVERGNVFHAANQTTVTTQAGLSATTPALTLYNRAGSGKVVKVWYTGAVSLVAPAAAAAIWACLGGGANIAGPTTVTDATVRNAKTGLAGLPQGVAVYSVATLDAAPVVIGLLGAQLTGLITTTPFSAVFGRWWGGALWVPEGFNFTIQTSTASTLFCDYNFEVVAK